MPCPICSTSQTSSFARKDEWCYARCAACGFIFLDPMPAQVSLEEMYIADCSTSTEHFPKARSRHTRALRRGLRLLPYVFGKRSLDIGCGGGFMANALRVYGAHSSGLDINAHNIAYAKQRFPRCHFYCAPLTTFSSDQAYDFIYSSEVIEHVGDLAAYITLLRNVSRIGSYLFITTPDSASPNVPRDFASWDVCAPPQHVQFFNETNLSLLLRQAGFIQHQRWRDSKAGLKVLFRRSQ